MTIAALAKIAASIAIPTGTSKIVGFFAKQAMAEATKPERICCLIASSAISGLIADKATENMHKNIDELANTVKGFKDRRKAKRLVVKSDNGQVKEVIDIE